jgi:hypothetical protein
MEVMRYYKIVFATFLLFPVLFVGCGGNNPVAGDTGTANSRKGDSQTVESEGAVRQTPPPQSPETTSTPNQYTVIATRPGSGGLEVDLTSVAITGDILTVSLRFRPNSNQDFSMNLTIPIEQVSITDDATSRRYGVLKDQSGQYMASPLSGENVYFTVNSPKLYSGTFEVAWFKFPVPPQGQTISINVPKVAPFDNIRIQR